MADNNGFSCPRAALNLGTLLLLVLAFFSIHGLAEQCNCQAYKDISLLPDVFESSVFPSQHCCLPSVGNGYLATVINTDTIYVNGIYNGHGGNSHRARIPSTAAINVVFPPNETIISKSYALDLRNGTFIYQLKSSKSTIEQRIYAHQNFSYLLIHEISVTRSNTMTGPISYKLVNMTGDRSTDIDFKQSPVYGNTRMMYGNTTETETNTSSVIPVAVNWTAIPEAITLQSSQRTNLWTFITAIGPDSKSASAYHAHGQQLAAEGHLYTDHVKAWQTRWNHGQIDVDNLSLSKAIYGCMYYILSSLPIDNWEGRPHHFYGLSPGGLSHGAQGKDYEGHVFWDQETWMYPTMLMFHPGLGRSMLESRSYQLDGAKALAKSRGYKGAEYPWEMAYTGAEVCPAEVYAIEEIHINGDIPYAVQQYLYMTRDTDFLMNSRGYEMIYDLASYWASRVTYNQQTAQYDINGVKPPDEFQTDVNNSVYTNTVAQISLRLPQYAATMINATAPPTNWTKIADQLSIPFDETRKSHPEFDGYQFGDEVKQADVILLGFPLDTMMEQEVRLADLNNYEPVTDSNGPAMSWAMFSIGYGDVKLEKKRQQMFQRSLENIRQPFRVWTEDSSGSGATNFITGMGGFLQSVLFGYGGFRIHKDYLAFDFSSLPPNTTVFKVTGLDYLGSEIDFLAKGQTVSVTLTSQATGAMNLSLKTEDGTVYKLSQGKTVTIDRSSSATINADASKNNKRRVMLD